MAKLVDRRVANALIADARPSAPLRGIFNVAFLGMGDPVGSRLRRWMGGLWVGGTFCVYEDRLLFEPNSMNRIFHANGVSFEIPWSSITKLGWRRGVLTNIIEIWQGEKVQAVRCFGAKRLLLVMEDLRRASI